MTTRTMIDTFKAARRAGTPLVAVTCFDPAATVQTLKKAMEDIVADTPVIQWDRISGIVGVNDPGQEAATNMLGGKPVQATLNPVGLLEMAIEAMPADAVLIMMNAHLDFDRLGKPAQPEFIQAVWNCRDEFKSNGRALVLLGPSFDLPAELQQDVLVLDEQLPSDEQLRKIIESTTSDAGVHIDEEILSAAVDSLRGIAAFPAEQAVAMSMTKKNGLNVGHLWERKRQLINATPGLTVWLDGYKFDDLGGLDEVKRRFRRILAGRRPPRVVVWIDEIEKSGVASTGDSSGTNMDQLGVLLSEMQEKDYQGAIFVGVPGAAKSALAKAVGNEAGVLTIKFDLGDMKGQFVGQSEAKIRHAMKVVEAVGGKGGAFFIATSNNISSLKPELKRRFKKGTWFFDLPTAEERLAIWKIKCEAKGIVFTDGDLPADDGWTGAEIENCVNTAWEEDITLREAADTVIPVAVSGRDAVMQLRREAIGTYLSVSYPGTYQEETKNVQAAAPRGRKINLADE